MKSSNYFRFLLLNTLVLGLLLVPAQSPAAATQKTLPQVQQELDATKKSTLNKVYTLNAQMTEEQKRLRAERQSLTDEVAQRKLQAEALQAEFTALKEQEQELTKALEEKKSMMDSIQSTVGNNANLFLQAAPTYISQNLSPEQSGVLENLVQSKTFPTLASIEVLLAALQEGIYKSGTVQKGKELISTHDGKQVEADILHLGAFQSYYSYGGAVGFTLRTRILEPLEMVPYTASVQEKELLQAAFTSAAYTLPIDVTEGEILLSPPKQYSVWVSVQESGFFGWCIVAIGIIGLLLVVERYIALSRVKLQGESLASQTLENLKDTSSKATNPAGRVVWQMLFQENETAAPLSMDPQALERRAEEAMLKEMPALEKFLNTIRIFAAVAPLLGLLGTVSGIVTTFRVITAFGNSDPKLLSGGISEALLTTEMGLLVAIPLLLAHHFLSRKMNSIVLDMELASTIVIRQYTK